MGNPQRYRGIEVANEGWVSSTFHYHVLVYVIEDDYRFLRVFLINALTFLSLRRDGYVERPQYVVNEVLRQLREKIEGGKFRWFETNRQGVRRYTNLRYFDESELVSMMKTWRSLAVKRGA